MTVEAFQWENRLLDLAYEGLSGHLSNHALENDAQLLNSAYDICAKVTHVNSRTFYLASALLPKDKRKGARALYAFSRVCDEIVDNPGNDPFTDLLEWKSRSLHIRPRKEDLIPLAWSDTRIRFQIPIKLAEQLIDGIARDLYQTRYETFLDLATYCYGVACTVGLMSMHITGYESTDAIPYAIRLGVALQITNILRDVADDWTNGRLYLPQEELDAFNIKTEEIALGMATSKWREFMKFQIDRVRHLYKSAYPGIALLDKDGRFAIAAAGELYQGILDEIEAIDYDVFSQRAYLARSKKLFRLPGIWFRSRSLSYY